MPRLQEAGCRVRVLTRRSRVPEDGVEFVTGDLATGSGIEDAVASVETVVHLAGSAKGDDGKARNLVCAASRAGVQHVVNVSVVGVGRVPVVSAVDRAMFGYFAMKRASERIVDDSGLPWTTLRATQLYDRILMVAQQLVRPPVIPVPAGVRFQPVDAAEVAGRLVELSLGTPSGLVPDVAGPRVYETVELMRSYLRVTRPASTAPPPQASREGRPSHASRCQPGARPGSGRSNLGRLPQRTAALNVIVHRCVALPPSVGVLEYNRTHVRARVRGTPGPELIGELDSIDVSRLHPIERSWALTAVARMESWLAAQRCRLLLELGADFEHRLGGGNAADEVMAAQHVSAYAAERLVRLARSAGRAPALLEGLEVGRLGVPQAHRLSQHLEGLDTPDAAAVAATVCCDPRLTQWSVGEIGRAAARVAAELDPKAAAERRRHQERQADVSMEPVADGMGWLTAYGSAEDVAAAMTVVNEHALAAWRAEDEAGKEQTPIGVLRFQALVRLLLGGGSKELETSTVVTHVTVPFTTLASIDEAPGELAGYGPIPAPVARDLAASPQCGGGC